MKHVRIVTATALFDGHDVSINLLRRILQRKGCEVIHLGHSRSVNEVVETALQEDADAILVSSYQGGHNEYFQFLVDRLKEENLSHVTVFGGGGGVILPSEIEALEAYGVERLYHAEIGRKIGLQGIVDDILHRILEKKESRVRSLPEKNEVIGVNDFPRLASVLTMVEESIEDAPLAKRLKHHFVPVRGSLVLGITGTGGSGKSSLTDEIISRFLKVSPNITIAVLAVDPTRTSTGGALLGDRIRMNSIYNRRIFLRSMATRDSGNELSSSVKQAIAVCKSAGFSIVIVETSGIGQNGHAIKEIADLSMYVMTAEFGAPTQLEKIDMLELTDFTVLNKCRRPESEDAFRQILLHHVRLKEVSVPHSQPGALFKLKVPVYATEANEFNHHGVNALFLDLLTALRKKGSQVKIDERELKLLPTDGHRDFQKKFGPSGYYLAEVADALDRYHAEAEQQAVVAEAIQALDRSIELLSDEGKTVRSALSKKKAEKEKTLSEAAREFLKDWPNLSEQYRSGETEYLVRNKSIKVTTIVASLSGLSIPKVALPRYRCSGELVRFFYKENLPGYFPFTAGVFPFKSTAEDPKRQFAGEGSPEKTNKRLHFLSQNDPAKRLSIAFDPLTLYGESPAERMDIYGKIGESGVSIATLDDMKRLFAGFDLTSKATSVSMTINGPAPVILAMYFMTAVSQAEEKYGRALTPSERLDLFRSLRGTVQADILKEDQSQNTCIFSIDFALRLMGAVQSFFSANSIRNYYSVSISGYHIAESGANPLTQLAFTLANGFHYVEHFLSLGLKVDDFAHNLSFFFSNGLDPEYAVLGRVARRIWAVAMRDKYGASERSQKLKYHIQTSGRSLHAQEMELNDIRTTLQALMAYYDNCNSLHTNAYDEAVTTPTEESVRRAMAIQMIVAREFGLTKNENPNQGSFIIEELTDLVEKAVLEEFRNIARRGGVVGAMEKQYQRSRIQEESLYYEEQKQSGALPIVGVNIWVKEGASFDYDRMEVRRAAPEEKAAQLARLHAFEEEHKENAGPAIAKLRECALSGGNLFEALLDAVQVASLGTITKVLFELGGQYRRNL